MRIHVSVFSKCRGNMGLWLRVNGAMDTCYVIPVVGKIAGSYVQMNLSLVSGQKSNATSHENIGDFL